MSFPARGIRSCVPNSRDCNKRQSQLALTLTMCRTLHWEGERAKETHTLGSYHGRGRGYWNTVFIPLHLDGCAVLKYVAPPEGVMGEPSWLWGSGNAAWELFPVSLIQARCIQNSCDVCDSLWVTVAHGRQSFLWQKCPSLRARLSTVMKWENQVQ